MESAKSPNISTVKWYLVGSWCAVGTSMQLSLSTESWLNLPNAYAPSSSKFVYITPESIYEKTNHLYTFFESKMCEWQLSLLMGDLLKLKQNDAPLSCLLVILKNPPLLNLATPTAKATLPTLYCSVDPPT